MDGAAEEAAPTAGLGLPPASDAPTMAAGLPEAQESVPALAPTVSSGNAKPNRPPPSRPDGGQAAAAKPKKAPAAKAEKNPSVPSRRPPSRPTPTPTPSVVPVASAVAVTSRQLADLQARLTRLGEAPAEEAERDAGSAVGEEELHQLVDRIADLIDLRASLEQHAALLSAWRAQFLAESASADVLSVLQQARIVSELASPTAFELVENVTTMVRLSEGMESDELFLRQLRRKYLDNLTL